MGEDKMGAEIITRKREADGVLTELRQTERKWEVCKIQSHVEDIAG